MLFIRETYELKIVHVLQLLAGEMVTLMRMGY